MKFIKATKINYLIVISITVFSTWLYLSYDNNKFVSASEKSISSVVTVLSYQRSISNSNPSQIGSGVIFSKDGYIVTNLSLIHI